MRIPKNLIIEYVHKYITKDDYKFSTDGAWINFNSEFTTDDRKCMGINLETGMVNDYKTGSMGFVQFVKEHQDLKDSSSAEAFLFKMGNGMAIEKRMGSREKMKNLPDKPDVIQAIDLSELKKIPEMRPFDKDLSNVGRSALRYLIGRGIGPRHIKKFNLQYSDSRKCWYCHGTGYDEDDDSCDLCNGTGNNRYYNKIIIPTYENGKIVYFQGRTIEDDDTLRYINPKLPRMQVVYFHDLLKENEDIYITEGPFDAMTLINYNATCLMSMRITDPLILKLAKKSPRRIIFVPQVDETPEKRDRARKNLESNIKRIIHLTDDEIPVGIYHWYQGMNQEDTVRLKDINAAKIVVVDESKIEMRNKRTNIGQEEKPYEVYSSLEQSHITPEFCKKIKSRISQ